MSWKLVAEGTSLEDLGATVDNHELKKGTRVRVIMDLKVPAAWAFDIAPNWSWPAPEGMSIVDIRGEGSSTGIVEMEADPAFLFAVIGFMIRHWLMILIAGTVLYLIIKLIKIFKWIEDVLGIPPWVILAGIGLLVVISKKKVPLLGGG